LDSDEEVDPSSSSSASPPKLGINLLSVSNVVLLITVVILDAIFAIIAVLFFAVFVVVLFAVCVAPLLSGFLVPIIVVFVAPFFTGFLFFLFTTLFVLSPAVFLALFATAGSVP
jgi:hypothetical protein